MKCTLMQKDYQVLKMNLDDDDGHVMSVSDIYDRSRVPVGVNFRNDKIVVADLRAWWQARSIPASRDGIRAALEQLHYSTALVLTTKSYGLSLSDQYWVCPEGKEFKWSDINFFTNPFSDDIGDLLVSGEASPGAMNMCSPDNTSDGWLKKRWKIIKGMRCLMKAGSGLPRQEPFNEVAAYIIAQRLGITCTEYVVFWVRTEPYSVCENFITPDTELISAYRILSTAPKSNNDSWYQHLIKRCDALNVPGAQHFLDQLLVLDFLCANEDRHFNNFGVIRDVNTLEYKGFSPVFDTGTSFYYRHYAKDMDAIKWHDSKPFKSTHELQLNLVKDFSWLDLGRLIGVEEELYNIYVQMGARADGGRPEAIVRGFQRRVKYLQEFVNKGSGVSKLELK